MPPSTRIPPLLQPYVHVARDDSFLILTSTVGASANWLLLRFLCDTLSNTARQGGGGGEGEGEEERNVVLVSWMREYDFWKQEARKGVGLDLERLRREGRLAFVHGLGTGLDASVQQSHATDDRPARSAQTPHHYTLHTLELAHVQDTISAAVAALAATSSAASTPPRKTLLILDNPDLLLALNPTITPASFTSLVLGLHTLPTMAHVLMHMQADNPLLSLSTPAQPLELAHHNLIVKYAHMSTRILGVRVLDTGVARDVSGVIRITEHKAQGIRLRLDREAHVEGGESGNGKEFLYQVKGDGSVRVFERGAGGEG
ncbi:hypothetical protein BDW02DRAFT_348233 [Decorospora gaudefroyi]|uniref:Elongator complex protein 6 n=1 Tax=Decorospora gaudefroyi TaxID=184978 RepID=A0A6A5KF93_9PLEO|nr:hypothetical protein BDW02DRAFT_348233 [Decorospora gaudefroyi]